MEILKKIFLCKVIGNSKISLTGSDAGKRKPNILKWLY